MSESSGVLLTVEQVERWEKEATELARRITDDQAQLENLRQKIKYAQYFKPKANPFNDFFTASPDATPAAAASASGNWGTTWPPAPPPAPTPAAVDSNDLTAAVERLANAATRPLAKKALKAALAGEGFAADRLANYFYTAIHRLKAKNRITVLSDGSVWKAVPGAARQN